MLSIEEAQRTILGHITSLETEKVSLFQGLNRVTPEDHIAPCDIPPADNSAMDGYAFCHAALSGNRLRVLPHFINAIFAHFNLPSPVIS